LGTFILTPFSEHYIGFAGSSHFSSTEQQMSRTLREVAREPGHENRLFAERLESEVTSEYMLLALIAEMSMDQEREPLRKEYEQLRFKIVAREDAPEDLSAEEKAELALDYARIEELRAILEQPAYAPMRQFSSRTKSVEEAKRKLSAFKVVGRQRPLDSPEL
jgi:hypothetical protein